MGSSPTTTTATRSDAGSVFLIGSDPERPGALSWPALAALAAADVVLHDGAADPATLALVPRRVLVEAAAGDIGRVSKLAGEGWRVVWLVSGDPANSPARRVAAERLREAGIATHTIAGFLHCEERAVFAAAAATAGPVAPQPLATALNGLAG
jgi:uroporphyrin-III C-methyltransferase